MSSNLPTVTVVVPSFNRMDAIQRAIDSALYQTHKPLEVIVVDDASSDKTREIVASIPAGIVIYIVAMVLIGQQELRRVWGIMRTMRARDLTRSFRS